MTQNPFFLIQVIVITLQLFLLGLTVILSQRYRRKVSMVGSTYECDRLYMETLKLLLQNEDLYSFYAVGPKEEVEGWEKLSSDEKRMWIFSEMNYFNFAFVYREYLRGSVTKGYWEIYENWLIKLLKYSPLFRDVHLYSREHFEDVFKRHVDNLLNRI